MIRYVSPIDPHVHLRGNEYAFQDPSFANLAFRDAQAVGLAALIEQPNTSPPLTNKETIQRRFKEIDEIRGNTDHYIHVALTPNPEQREAAIHLIKNNPRIVSAKSFYVKSTNSGEIELTDPKDQMTAWEQVARMRYFGPVIGHFEYAQAFNKSILFDPKRPMTHSLHQCPESEVIQFENQFRFAYDSGYKGMLVVLHTSNPETIKLSEKLIKQHSPKFGVAYETTWHHMFLNTICDYPIHGNLVKMNPPLRSLSMQQELLNLVLEGRTHFIGTDHAPHNYIKKISDSPPSGIPAIPFWPKGIELLRKLKVSEEKIQDLTFEFANRLYCLNQTPKSVEVEYDPRLWQAYGWNPFSRIDQIS